MDGLMIAGIILAVLFLVGVLLLLRRKPTKVWQDQIKQSVMPIGPFPITAGASQDVETTSLSKDGHFRAQRLIVNDGRFFTITKLCIEKTHQMMGEVPAEVFAPNAMTGMGDPYGAGGLNLQTIGPGMTVVIGVRNETDKEQIFQAVLIGKMHTKELREPPKKVKSRKLRPGDEWYPPD